ncbi:acyl-CoA carboxylase subunit beta [Pseudooceanicola aestuarii]|uniref:acyl-CoA carboxylase subunit beta n=1 Tax=Pseudooceanicola aestuarii TaxID=2697319 RepID=UPI0013D64011|nr:carboxyl transferase domain-containing protein [Pseudooceanicola aestuarii]
MTTKTPRQSPKTADSPETGWAPEMEELQFRRARAEELGGAEAVAFQHGRDKLTVRERIDVLSDAGSFRELGKLTGKGRYDEHGRMEDFTPSNSVVGYGRVNGRKVVISGDDFTIRAGSSESTVSDKWVYAERIAHEYEMPLVRLVDTAGGSVKLLEQQQATKLPGYARWPSISLLGKVPVVGMALGACAGLGAIKVGISHFSVMVKDQGFVFAGGPPVVKQGLGQDVTKEALGGSRVHTRSGVVMNEARDEQDAFEQVKRFLSFMPPNIWETPDRIASDDDPERADPELDDAIPRDRRKVYDPRAILNRIVDQGSFFEVSRRFGGSVITGYARLNGHAVGIIANDPVVKGGALTLQAAQKMARFVDICDSFHLPVVNFVDQPGVMTGLEAETAGTMSAAIGLLGALEQVSVPWCSIIIRRAFGVGGGAHGPKHGPEGRSLNYRFAWPSARWGSIPIEGGVAAAYKKDITAAEDPDAFREELEAYYHRLASPFRTAEKFGIVDIIAPRETRSLLCDWVADAHALTTRQTGPKRRTMR